jgi:hypothetical protein
MLNDLKNKNIKLRLIKEVTKDNIARCKELLKITELRHLDGIKGNFGIVDGNIIGDLSTENLIKVGCSELICLYG